MLQFRSMLPAIIFTIAYAVVSLSVREVVFGEVSCFFSLYLMQG